MYRVWLLLVTIFIRETFCALVVPPSFSPRQSYDYLLVPLARHFRNAKLPVNFCFEKDAHTAQLDTVNELLRGHQHWMVVTVHHHPACPEPRLFFQNVLQAATYDALERMIFTMDYGCYDIAGYYMITVADRNLNERSIEKVFELLWTHRLVNVVFIAPVGGENYTAYSYDPYARDESCGRIRLVQVDRYFGNHWQHLSRWFQSPMRNLNGCPLQIGTFEVQPFSMVQQRDDKTASSIVGLEVDILRAIAAKLNFSCQFVAPEGNQKWGLLNPGNSTGLMGMIERGEVDLGFAAIGHSPHQSRLLRSSYPGIITQLIMAIPPKEPYSSLEKLLQPFTAGAWTLIVVCYSILCLLFALIFCAQFHPFFEHIPGMFYTMWTILMGGPGGSSGRHSTRLYFVSLLLNAFVVRNLYQSALFQYLKSSEVLPSNLNTYDDINAAGLCYYMHSTTATFFQDNPWVNKRIHTLPDGDVTDLNDVLYNLSQHLLDGVLTLPLESISYYVKHHGQRGMVYVGADTGISYYIGFHFPRLTALKEPFDRLLHRFYDAGFTVHWKRNFRDNPDTWVNKRKDNGPTPLCLHQVSGGFYLWAFCMICASIVFATEIVLFSYAKINRKEG